MTQVLSGNCNSCNNRYYKNALTILKQDADRTGQPITVLGDKLYRYNASKISPKFHNELAQGIRQAVQDLKRTYNQMGNNSKPSSMGDTSSVPGNKTYRKNNEQSRHDKNECVRNKMSQGVPYSDAVLQCDEELGGDSTTDENTKNAGLFSGSFRSNNKSPSLIIYDYLHTGSTGVEDNPTTAREYNRILSASRKIRESRIEGITGFSAALITRNHLLGEN